MLFICYAHEDKSVADRLRGDLKENGYETWMDSQNQLGATNLYEIAEEVIFRARHALILFSRNTHQSGKFQRFEILLAATAVQLHEGSDFLIPIVVEKCKIPGHPVLKNLSPIMLHSNYEEGLSLLLRTLTKAKDRRKFRSLPATTWADLAQYLKTSELLSPVELLEADTPEDILQKLKDRTK